MKTKPTPAPTSARTQTSGISAAMVDGAVLALEALLRFEQPADAVLSAYFRERKQLGGRERAFIAETVYTVLRRRRLLGKLAPQATARQLVLAALTRIDCRSQRQLGAAISAADGQWLETLRGQPEPQLSFAEQTDLPDWLVERLLRQTSAEEVLAMAHSFNQAAPLDLRVNTLKAKREEVLASFAAEGIVAEACRYSPVGIRLKSKPALQRHPLFLGGSVEVQDEGSQLLGFLLAPKRGELVVDFCAGAGGKTLLLGALMRSSGRLYAFDVADKRLAKMKPRLARAGLSNVHPVRLTGENDSHVKRLAGKIDRVLVDAPCSGLGTLRRNPDLKWRQTPAAIEELQRKQAAILASAARLVKPGGRLVYATCSILREENEDVVDAFLATHAQFSRLSAETLLAEQGINIACGADMHLSPLAHATDAFFAVALQRSVQATSEQ